MSSASFWQVRICQINQSDLHAGAAAGGSAMHIALGYCFKSCSASPQENEQANITLRITLQFVHVADCDRSHRWTLSCPRARSNAEVPCGSRLLSLVGLIHR